MPKFSEHLSGVGTKWALLVYVLMLGDDDMLKAVRKEQSLKPSCWTRSTRTMTSFFHACCV